MIKVDGLDKLSTTGMPTENRKVTRPATAKENKSAAKTAVAFIKKTEAQSKLPYNYSRM